jgi:hypothetical protein
MFKCYLPDSPPETFQEMLWRLNKTEEEYDQYLKDKEEAEIGYYMDLLTYGEI